MTEFVVKDSGKRQDFDSGMRRDTEDGKPDLTLAIDGPMFERFAAHITKGAEKYGPRNWQKANSQEELDRFKRSAFRHFVQWLRDERDEDHAAAVIFNLNCAEYVRDRLDGEDKQVPVNWVNNDPVHPIVEDTRDVYGTQRGVMAHGS